MLLKNYNPLCLLQNNIFSIQKHFWEEKNHSSKATQNLILFHSVITEFVLAYFGIKGKNHGNAKKYNREIFFGISAHP